jgi:hypothetical protein
MFATTMRALKEGSIDGVKSTTKLLEMLQKYVFRAGGAETGGRSSIPRCGTGRSANPLRSMSWKLQDAEPSTMTAISFVSFALIGGDADNMILDKSTTIVYALVFTPK